MMNSVYTYATGVHNTS